MKRPILTPRFLVLAGVCAGLLAHDAGRALAQQAQPAADPQIRGEDVERTLEGMRKRGSAAAAPVAPSPERTPVVAQPTPGQARAPAGDAAQPAPASRRWREGAFFTGRSGSLVRARTGDWIFVPRPSADAGPDGPLVLIPSINLERLERSIPAGQDRPAVTLSGQVFGYRGRDYLLLGEASGPAIQAPPPVAADQGSPAPPAESGSAEDLIRRLESAAPAPRALPRLPAPRAEAAPAEALPRDAAAEGSLITARRGRVIRLDGGELGLCFDNDSISQDRTLPLAPCRVLEKIESISLWRADGVALEVSGRVLSYRGRASLLPTMVVIPPPSEISPLQ